MIYLLMVLQLAFSKPTENPCSLQHVKATKTTINATDYIFHIPPQNVSCFESQNKFRQKIYDDFKESVSAKTNTEPLYLLTIQRNLFAKHLPDYVEMFDLVIKGTIGAIRDINILEAFLLTEHLKLNPNHSEFGAYILKSPQGGLKIYFTSNSEASVPQNKGIMEFIDKDVANGYKFSGHLHNHPFLFDPKYEDIAGTTVPSYPDASTYQTFKAKYDLDYAYVTNGFSTIAIPKAQFELFPKVNLPEAPRF